MKKPIILISKIMNTISYFSFNITKILKKIIIIHFHHILPIIIDTITCEKLLKSSKISFFYTLHSDNDMKNHKY